ncbi:hypothetical protein CQA66_00980 [Helicobacter aurati]|uniref:PDZ domain-containing protein n=1 Tax=Helicobacter aurati TaxID=137778 RepID=A0A3D8JAE6_9HELI|nr:hypothetical protein CQA66_00980 [Helicobacter aurati]
MEEKIDYSYCANYYRQASIYLGDGIYAIALKNGAIIGYSPTKPRSKRVQRYDKFSGLFLVGNSSTKMSYEISDIDEYALSKELASAGIKGAVPGKFQKHQSGFLQYAEFSAPTQRNGVISNICYKIYGLSVGGNGFIEKRYIERFLSQQTPYYGDLGVRFEVLDSESATFGVKFADPFFPNNPFKRGDILVSINDVAPKNWGDLELMVADLPFGEEAIVKIRRNEEEGIRTFRVKVGKRFGGMLLPDSFLERFNLIISNDFIVQKAPSSGPFSKLRKGDKILFINNIDMRQFHVKSTRERNQLLQELFTKIQSHQVDAIALLQDEEKRKQYAKIINKDILAQFQNKDVATRYDSFYRKMSENMEDFINPETSRKDKIPTSNAIDDIDLESFRGDEILRDSGTKSMRTIYDSYDIEGNLQPTNKKDTIKEYDMLTQHGLGMNFLIDRKGFQFRVPLE